VKIAFTVIEATKLAVHLPNYLVLIRLLSNDKPSGVASYWALGHVPPQV